MTQSFVIHGKLPSLNDVIRSNRGNRYAAARKKRELEAMIGWAIRCYNLVPMTGMVRITVRWVEPNQRRDYDNIQSAVKFIQDALKRGGIIAGDGQKHLAPPVHEHEVDRFHPRVEVTLEEIA